MWQCHLFPGTSTQNPLSGNRSPAVGPYFGVAAPLSLFVRPSVGHMTQAGPRRPPSPPDGGAGSAMAPDPSLLEPQEGPLSPLGLLEGGM